MYIHLLDNLFFFLSKNCSQIHKRFSHLLCQELVTDWKFTSCHPVIPFCQDNHSFDLYFYQLLCSSCEHFINEIIQNIPFYVWLIFLLLCLWDPFKSIYGFLILIIAYYSVLWWFHNLFFHCFQFWLFSVLPSYQWCHREHSGMLFGAYVYAFL